jgi:hypothetical protein
MDRNYILYIIDCAMGIVFVMSFTTGLLKFTLLLRLPGLNTLVLPSALISDIHDGAGILLGCFVFLHLYMNRRWIVTMTRKIRGVSPQSP